MSKKFTKIVVLIMIAVMLLSSIAAVAIYLI